MRLRNTTQQVWSQLNIKCVSLRLKCILKNKHKCKRAWQQSKLALKPDGGHKVFPPPPSLVKQHHSTQDIFFFKTKWWAAQELVVRLLPTALSQCPENCPASTDLEVFPAWSKHSEQRCWLINTSYWREVSEPSTVFFIILLFSFLILFILLYYFEQRCTVLYLAFCFDSSLYSGSISVRVEVQGRHHSGVCGFMGLTIQRKLERLNWLK